MHCLKKLVRKFKNLLSFGKKSECNFCLQLNVDEIYVIHFHGGNMLNPYIKSEWGIKSGAQRNICHENTDEVDGYVWKNIFEARKDGSSYQTA